MTSKLLASLLATVLTTVPVYAITPEPPCECEEPETGGNPGNGKPVGNSPWDGITGNSGKNGDRAPAAAPMDGQRADTQEQPGDKGEGPSSANK